MKKIEVGPRNFMYPMPTTLVGAIVAGKPNYITIAHVGVMKYATLSVSCTRGTTPTRASRKAGPSA